MDGCGMKARIFGSHRLARAVIAVAALAAASPAMALTYYFVQDNTTNVGADGACNLTAANTIQRSYQWKTTASTTGVGGAVTQMATSVATTSWYSMGRVYGPVLDSATMITAANATLYLRNAASGDLWQVIVKDYDPSGGAGNGTDILTSEQKTGSTTATPSTVSFTAFTGTVRTVPSGHRLMFEVMFKPATSSNIGRLYVNTTTYSSRVVLTEAAPPTTTVGNTSEPASTNLNPGAAPTALDAFTLKTDSGTNAVTAATVTIPSGAAGLATVSIQNTSLCNMGTPLGTLSTLADGANTVPTTGLTATTTLTTYYVCATPKAATAMPAPPGATYAITGTVTGLTCSNTVTANDTGSATLTIDNQSPASPGTFGGTPGNNSVSLSWSNPADADYAQLVVLRWLGAAGSQVPVEGKLDYAAGNTIGTATVACAVAAPGTACTDGTAVNGSAYTYKAFARDTLGNYSVGLAAGPYTPSTGATTLVGNGASEPPGGSVTPGAAATALDAFTLRTDSGTDAISAVTVTIPSGTAGLESVSIQNTSACNMGSPLGTLSTLADGANGVPVSITATVTETTYHVCVKPKSHLLMPLPPGATYAVSSTVTGLASSNVKSYGDGGSATITIDNQSPANPGAFAGTAGTNTVSLTWTRPADADYAATVVLRWTGGAAGAEVPSEGNSGYAVGAVVGAATVACVVANPGASCADNGAVGGFTYSYKAFARDATGNYSTGAAAGPFSPTGASTTVGDGTAPASVTVAPGALAVLLDTFTLQTNGGSDAVAALTVTIPSGTSALERVTIQDTAACDMGTPLGTQTALADGANAISLTGVTATATLATYHVCVKPKPHASFAAPPGASYPITGKVTALTSTFPKSYGDASSATITVDNLSPANPGSFTGSPASGLVYLTWTNPADADHAQTVVLRWQGAAGAQVPVEGAVYQAGDAIGAAAVACVVAKPGVSCLDYGVTNGTSYSYKAFARDTSGNHSTGVGAGPYTPAVNGTTVGTPAATVIACTQVTVSAPFTGDANGNGSTTVSRGATGAGPWTAVCTGVTGASPRSCADGAATPNATSYYQVELADADGVSGTNPQVVSATTSVCPDQLVVSVGTMPAGTAVAAGSSGVIVGRVVLTAQTGSVTLSSLAVQNLGTAVAGSDVASLGLFDDTSGAFLGTSAWSAASSRHVFSGLSQVVALGTPVTLRITLNVGTGATAARTFRMQVNAPADVTVAAPDTVGTATVTGSATAFTLQANTVLEGSTNPAAPMVSIITPAKGAVVSVAPAGNPGGAGFKVQLRVFDPAGIAAITANSVQVSTDNGTTWLATPLPARNTRFDTGTPTTTGTMYEALLTLTPGQYTLRARASNATVSNVLSAAVPVTVLAARSGDGNLLVRDNSSQLCTDCHAIQTHSSESAGTAKGSWSTTCRDCHTPHRTRNVYLVNEQVMPPAIQGPQAPRSVGFVKGSAADGDSAAAGWDATNGKPTATASFVNSDNSGPCQVCHTRTGSDATPRWRNTGNSDTHYTAAVGAQACTNCHSHGSGFGGGESKGGTTCSGCHKSIWDGMTGRTAKAFKHTLGDGSAADLGRNDLPTDSGITWSSPLATSNAPTARSCVNMCHSDHTHDVPGTSTTHEYNAYREAGTSAARANGTKDTATKAKTDFDATATNGGMCASCHVNPVAPGGIAVNKTSYASSAHNYSTFGAYGAWEYTQHDGGKFQRNCTKCHADRADARPGDSGTPFGAVHFSDFDSLLAGPKNPATTQGTVDATKRATFVCNNCHGNGTVGTNLSGKDLATAMQKTSNHPTDQDAIHDSVVEATATYNNGKFSGANRHASCMDCHDPHKAGATKHTPGTNAVASTSPIAGVTGVAFTNQTTTSWPTTSSAMLTWKASITAEYELCLKCHSSFAFGATPPTAPSGGSETDVAREFNTGNQSYHPVMGALPAADPSATYGSVRLVQNQLCGTTNCANKDPAYNWAPGQMMYCSDCHGSDANASGVQGPHGSAGKYVLKGPNRYWPTNSAGTLWTIGNQGAGLFCLNCHPSVTTTNTPHSNGKHTSYQCVVCHVQVPHGGKVSRLIVTRAAPQPWNYYAPNTDTRQLTNFTRAGTYTGYSESGQCGSGLSCYSGHSKTGGEAW
jgi:hypothetical protein